MSLRPRVYGYVRVSTDKQENSTETQKEKIRQYAAQRGIGEIDSIYADSAVSGKVPMDQRVAGKVLFEGLRRDDHLIITKIDRAFRSTADCAMKIDSLHRMGVKLHIVDFMGDSVDISTAQGRIFIHIVAAFAEYERELISQRTKEGLAFRKKKGVAHSRFPGYGRKWVKVKDEHGKLVKIAIRDDQEREVMGSIVNWRMQHNLSWEEIRVHLVYNLKIKTKEGTEWDLNRIRRCCKAELQLQLLEQRGSR